MTTNEATNNLLHEKATKDAFALADFIFGIRSGDPRPPGGSEYWDAFWDAYHVAYAAAKGECCLVCGESIDAWDVAALGDHGGLVFAHQDCFEDAREAVVEALTATKH